MTFEELRRLARQTNWEKSRLLFALLRKTMELINEDDYVNGYVRHLFNDDNNELEIYILTAKDKFLTASYLHEKKSLQVSVRELTDIESIVLTEAEDSETTLTINFNSGPVLTINSRDNYDCDQKNYLTDFARSLCNL